MSLFDDLKQRGYIYQTTNEEEIRKILDGKPSDHYTFYLGIDPTADSLHIGHFFALMMFRRLQKAGHKGILLIGGATGMVGDPSGKTDMRKMMTKEVVNHNLNEVKKIAKQFISTEGESAAIIVDNAEWMDDFSYIRFLREVGIHFNVNTMLQADAYAKRLEEGGLTYLEMGYMLMQAYDFVHLNKQYGCVLQIGGSDQWGNIVAGTNLSRKLSNLAGEDRTYLFGLTCPLLMNSDGTKMGKTEKGALWVAKDKTSTFDFYQYFYNVNDGDVEMLLKLFTDLSLQEIDSLIRGDIREAKRTMAYEITKLVHGVTEADTALETAKQLFSKNGANLGADAPVAELPMERLCPSAQGISEESTAGMHVVDLIVESGMLPSKSEARRTIEQGGVSINNEKVTDIGALITRETLIDSTVLLKVGKKKFLKVVFK